MKVKEESNKAHLKLNIQKVRSWHTIPSLHGKQMGKWWETLFSWAPKSLRMVTSAIKLKDPMLLGRKTMRNLDSVLKSRDIPLPTKVPLVKAMVFPAVMYECEGWTIKKAEHLRTDAFELWCWRRLLRIPWTARRSNQSILKEISPEYSLEGLILKLKLQYFGHLMQRADSSEKTMMLGKIEGRRKRGCQRTNGWMASLTQWTWVWASYGSWGWTGKPGVLQSMGSQRVGHDWATEHHQQMFGLPRWHSDKESACQCRRHKKCRFDPLVGKIPWSGKWQPTSVLLSGKFHGQKSMAGYSPQGHKKSDTT